jgi:trigger factor
MPINTEVTTLEENRVQLDVSVSQDEVTKAYERAVRQIARDVRIPGFRPGKVPPAVVVRRFGRDTIVSEMVKSSLGGWYEEAVADTGVRPIDDPDLDLDDVPEEGDLVFRATVQVRPTATLGKYKGLEVGRAEPEVPEGSLDAEIDKLRQRGARLSPVERAANAGDFVVIDFDGTADGAALAQASARDYLVELGAKRLVAGFDEKLQGMSAGDTSTFDITYADDDSRDELKGRTITYTATVKQVQEKILPELDDDLAAEVSEFDTLDELRADLQARLDKNAQATVDEAFRRAVIDAAMVDAKVDVPEVMINRRIGTILAQTAQSLPEGVSLESYLQATGRTLKDAIEQLTPESELAIRRELVCEAVAVAENISLTDDDVAEQIRTDAAEMGRDPDELIAEVRNGGAMETLREDMRLKRAVDVMVSGANPIPMEQAEAREKIWTPGEEKPDPGSKLWKPGDAK